MQTLDDIRAEIVRRFEDAKRRMDHAAAEIEAHDRAVAAMNSAAPPAPVRKERRDIAALVLGALTDQPQTVAQIAHAIGVQPGRVETALRKRFRGSHAEEMPTGWIKVRLASSLEFPNA